MGKIEDLHSLIEREGIILDITDSLPKNSDGIYIRMDDSYPIIGINQNIIHDRIKYSIVLAEELGHHFTSIGNSSGMYNSYNQRLELNRAELKAMKWATEFVLPLPEIKEIFLKYINCNLEDIIEKLEVPKDFLIKRLEFISKYTPFIELNENSIISLHSLPKIQIITKHNIY